MLHVKFVMINVLRDGLLILKSVKSPNLEIRKKIVKVCLHSSKVVQMSLQFDDFFYNFNNYRTARGKWDISDIS